MTTCPQKAQPVSWRAPAVPVGPPYVDASSSIPRHALSVGFDLFCPHAAITHANTPPPLASGDGGPTLTHPRPAPTPAYQHMADRLGLLDVDDFAAVLRGQVEPVGWEVAASTHAGSIIDAGGTVDDLIRGVENFPLSTQQ
jgi:hypothetical protein